MGGGASTVLNEESLKGLSNDDKFRIMEKMKAKYDELSPSIHEKNNATQEEILKNLENILEEETTNVRRTRQKSTFSAEMLKSASSAEFIPSPRSFDYNRQVEDMNDIMTRTRSLTKLNESLTDSPSGKIRKGNSSYNHSIDNEFNNDKTRLNKTSMDLIATLENSGNSKEMINKFLEKLQEEKKKRKSSEFRAKRLTFDADEIVETELTIPDEGEYQQDGNVMLLEKGSRSPKSPSKLAKRTSIFSSGELGVQQEKEPPFPIENVGTYSCHGVEPDPSSEDGLHQKINQDRGCMAYPYNGSYDEVIFLVLDGHGEAGDRISEFVMKQIVISLEKHEDLKDDPIKALKDTYTKTNTALMVSQIPFMKSGTTCVGVYIKGSKMFVANVGDSRAVMAVDSGNGVLKARDLSKDHKPDDPIERKRIEEWGGFVMDPPEVGLSARVYLDPEYTMIGLAMARSIGDYAVKEVGVIAEPDVEEYDLNTTDKFMILASDGVWEFISSQEAVDIVNDQIEFGCHAACEELIQVAATRWAEEEGDYRDDITAIVVQFPLPLRRDSYSFSSRIDVFPTAN